MKKLLITIEILSIIVAIVFGILWIKDPLGNYEPIVAMSGTISVVIELVRRYMRTDSGSDREIPDNPRDLKSWLIKSLYDIELSHALQLTIRLAQDLDDNDLKNGHALS